MIITDELRKAFDDCTVLPRIANAFECVYITKDAATAMLEDVEAENAKLRELVRELYHELDAATQYDAGGGRGVVSEFAIRMRELGVDA